MRAEILPLVVSTPPTSTALALASGIVRFCIAPTVCPPAVHAPNAAAKRYAPPKARPANLIDVYV